MMRYAHRATQTKVMCLVIKSLWTKTNYLIRYSKTMDNNNQNSTTQGEPKTDNQPDMSNPLVRLIMKLKDDPTAAEAMLKAIEQVESKDNPNEDESTEGNQTI